VALVHGKTLASSSDDSTVILWDVDVESGVRRVCHIANRNVSPEEWQRYLPDTPFHKTCPDVPQGVQRAKDICKLEWRLTLRLARRRLHATVSMHV